MNLLIGITILLVLMFSDAQSQPTSTSPNQNLAGVLVLAAIPMIAAAIQAFVVARLNTSNLSLKMDVKIAKISTLLHSLLWMGCSLATILLFQWQLLIRNEWRLGNLVLIDELLILAPMLVSLIGSWIIQFESQAELVPVEERSKERWDYVLLRCRVYLLIVLVPIATIIAVKDLLPLFEQINPAATAIITVAVIVSLLCTMPLVIQVVWKNHPMRENDQKRSLLQLCRAHGLIVRDIRIWDTGLQMVNALVAGVLPRFRILMISDLLLDSFPDKELHAILRHEAGHIRLKHLHTRIGFILLPVFSLLAFEFDPNHSFHANFAWLIHELLSIPVQPKLVLAFLFFGYMIAVTAWLSRKMEFEADLYSIGALLRSGKVAPPILSHSQSMSDALLRFAEQNPDQFAKRSLTHPSLSDRLDWIKKANRSPDQIRKFQLIFTLQRWVLASSILILTAVLLTY